ncbi:hypothetical protein NC652_029928 [Populus alba x Populus x berolinensis]|nr:hypothetical protein NC652_029928 [Populus alba x Populus x berolinensis]
MMRVVHLEFVRFAWKNSSLVLKPLGRRVLMFTTDIVSPSGCKKAPLCRRELTC